jgi:hypothetical protein
MPVPVSLTPSRTYGPGATGVCIRAYSASSSTFHDSLGHRAHDGTIAFLGSAQPLLGLSTLLDFAGKLEVLNTRFREALHHVMQEHHVAANVFTAEQWDPVQGLEILGLVKTKSPGLGDEEGSVRRIVVVEELTGEERRQMPAVDDDRHGDVDHVVLAPVLQEPTGGVVEVLLDEGVALAAADGCDGVDPVKSNADVLPSHGNEVVLVGVEQAVGHPRETVVGFQQLPHLLQVDELVERVVGQGARLPPRRPPGIAAALYDPPEPRPYADQVTASVSGTTPRDSQKSRSGRRTRRVTVDRDAEAGTDASQMARGTDPDEPGSPPSLANQVARTTVQGAAGRLAQFRRQLEPDPSGSVIAATVAEYFATPDAVSGSPSVAESPRYPPRGPGGLRSRHAISSKVASAPIAVPPQFDGRPRQNGHHDDP